MAESAVFDLLFRGARIFDGRGGPETLGDVAVNDGRIVAVSRRIGEAARRVVEADGLALMPGIIDSHTHFDAQITWDPTLSPSPALGVTTAVIGNCGFTIAPCRPADREITMRNLTQVEGMSIDALRAGIDWGFETFAEYMAQLRRRGSAANVAAYVGHSSVRTYVMGDDAARREATPGEIAQMQAIVREAMAAGAVGFASSTSPAHNGEGGLPMPSRLASDEEMAALVGAMGEGGRGVYMLTKGSHTAVAFLESLAAATGRPVMVAALLHNSVAPRVVFDDLDAIAAANARGHRLLGQVSCCALTMDFTLASPYPVEGLASWKPALGRSGEALKAVLASDGFRAGVRAELETATTFRLFNGEWDKVHVVETVKPALTRHEQRSIAAIAADEGRDPLDVMLDIALADDLRTVFTAQLLNSDEAAVGRMLNHPNSIVSLSDAGAHLTFFNDAGFGLHLLGHWSREIGAMSLGEAVRRLTSHPAGVLGLVGRGTIAAGQAADLLLFDPATVGRGPKRRVHDLPAGAPRLTTDALGVHGVWVNGVQGADARGLIADTPLAGELLTRFAS
jgi:N-acyl-D-aspartate/D-glutamate deacylase